MAAQFCTHLQMQLEQIAHHHGSIAFTFCVLQLMFSLVATLGNLLVIRALWKASSISATIKMFLSLAFSDLAVGLFVQLTFGVIIAVVLRMAANGDYNFDFLCPTVITVNYFFGFLLASASFLNVTAIAVDRLLAISLHLRYQELVTSKRVIIALVCLWITSGIWASLYISLPNHSNLVVAIIGFVGIILTTAAYIRIYKVARHHQNQIHNQVQQANPQVMRLHREKKSSFNALFVYVAFIVCYFPHKCTAMYLITSSSQISFSGLMAEAVAVFLMFLNSSLNPLVYCWRYREIREIVKSTVKKVFHINIHGT